MAIVVLIGAGTAGYVFAEGWSAADALYMVVITLSTVGFQEVRPLGPAGRAVTALLIVTGVATFAYVASAFMRFSIEGELRHIVGRRRMVRDIARLENHLILCGYGRVGREVCRNLLADEVPLIVIDRDEKALAGLDDLGVPHLRGDAVEEEVLTSARIQHARGLLLTLSSEADNVYVTLLARDLRPDLLVIARSVSEQGERRLVAAGANRVVSPERIGARSMSNTVTRPSTVDFTEIVTARENLELQLEEIRLSSDSPLSGKSIEECNIRRNFGLIVVGILSADGEMLFNPAPGQRLEAGATLIVLGRREDLRRFAAAS